MAAGLAFGVDSAFGVAALAAGFAFGPDFGAVFAVAFGALFALGVDFEASVSVAGRGDVAAPSTASSAALPEIAVPVGTNGYGSRGSGW
jgi:hypothetical protein